MKTYNQIEDNYYKYSNFKIIETMGSYAKLARSGADAGAGAGANALTDSRKIGKSFDASDYSAAENLFKNTDTSALFDKNLAKKYDVNLGKLSDADFNKAKLEATAKAIQDVKKKLNPGEVFDINDANIQSRIKIIIGSKLDASSLGFKPRTKPKLKKAKLNLKKFETDLDFNKKIKLLDEINFNQLDTNKKSLKGWLQEFKETGMVEVNDTFYDPDLLIDTVDIRTIAGKIDVHVQKIDSIELKLKKITDQPDFAIMPTVKNKKLEIDLYDEMKDELNDVSKNLLKEMTYEDAGKILDSFPQDGVVKQLRQQIGGEINGLKIKDEYSTELLNLIRKKGLNVKFENKIKDNVIGQIKFFQDYSKKIDNTLKKFEADNILGSIQNENAIKKLKGLNLMDKGKIYIKNLSNNPKIKNLTASDLNKIKKGEYPEDTQEIFENIKDLGELDAVTNQLLSNKRRVFLANDGINPINTKMKPDKKLELDAKHIKKNMDESTKQGFEKLKSKGKLPEGFETKNFDTLNSDELDEFRKLLKKSDDPDLNDIKKKLDDIDNFFLGDDLTDNYAKRFKDQMDFLKEQDNIDLIHKKNKIFDEVKEKTVSSMRDNISSFFRKKFQGYLEGIDKRKIKSIDPEEKKLFNKVKKLKGFEKFSNKKSFTDLSIDELGKFRNKLNDIEISNDDINTLKKNLDDIDKVYELESSFVKLKKSMNEIEIRKENKDLLKKKKDGNLKELLGDLKKLDPNLKDLELKNLNLKDPQILKLAKGNKKLQKKLKLADDLDVELKKMDDEILRINEASKGKIKWIQDSLSSKNFDETLDSITKRANLDTDLGELKDLVTNLKKNSFIDMQQSSSELKKFMQSYKKTKIIPIKIDSVKDVDLVGSKYEKIIASIKFKKKVTYAKGTMDKVGDTVGRLMKKYPRIKRGLQGLSALFVTSAVVYLFFGREITNLIEGILGIENTTTDNDDEEEEVKKECELKINPYNENGNLYSNCTEQLKEEKLCRLIINPYKNFNRDEFTISKKDIELSFDLDFSNENLSVDELKQKLENLKISDFQDKLDTLATNLEVLSTEKGYEILKKLNKLPEAINLKIFQNLDPSEIDVIKTMIDNLSISDLEEKLDITYSEIETLKDTLNNIKNYLVDKTKGIQLDVDIDVNLDVNFEEFTQSTEDELTNENLNNQIYIITSKINELDLFIKQLKNNYNSCQEKKEEEDKCMDEKHPNESRDYCSKCPELYRTRKLVGSEEFKDDTYFFGGFQQCECKNNEILERETKYSSCQNKFNEILCMNTKNTSSNLNYLSCNHTKGIGFGIDSRRNLNDPINPDEVKNSESDDFLDSHYMIQIWGMTEEELEIEVTRLIEEENNTDLANAIITCWEDYQYLEEEQKQDFLSLPDEEKAAVLLKSENVKINDKDELVYEYDDFVKSDEKEEEEEKTKVDQDSKKDNKTKLAKFLESKTFIYLAIGVGVFFFLIIIILILKKKKIVKNK